MCSMASEPAELRAYQVVLAHIEGGILNGTYRKGDLLPPERGLAAQLNVGRSRCARRSGCCTPRG